MILSLALMMALPDQSTPARPPRPAVTMTAPVPAQLPLAIQFDITSVVTGRTYRIYVSKPVSAPPKAGFPVLYVLDADAAFPTAKAQVQLATLTGGPPALVVGIGYPDVMASMALRTRDLTPFTPDATTLTMEPGTARDYGGGDDFHRFMTTELRPVIDRMWPVDPGQQSLMGYSLGGLFTLRVLLHDPGAYRNYIIGSPSIWWNENEVLKEEPRFAAKVRAGKIAPRILITSAGWEQASALTPPDETHAKDALDARFRMVDNARELADRLGAIKGPAPYRVDYVVFPKETHNSGIPASTSRGVAFIQER